jgi:hypothetical protein
MLLHKGNNTGVHFTRAPLIHMLQREQGSRGQVEDELSDRDQLQGHGPCGDTTLSADWALACAAAKAPVIVLPLN